MELRICREHGISHSHFMGGPRQWTESDRAKAMALVILEAEQCPACNTLRDDWLDEEGKPLAEPVWTPELRFCPGCAENKRFENSELTDQHRDAGGYVTFSPLVDYMARNGS